MEPSEFWNKIKLLLSEQGKTQDWLFTEAGLPIQSMRNRIYKDRIPGFEDTMKIFSVLHVNAEDFYGASSLKFEKNRNLKVIPVYNQVFSAGKGQYVPDSEEISDYISVPKELSYLGEENLAACHVRGDSMYPTLHDGDLIICDNQGYDGSEGIYIIQLNGQGFVKRLQKTPNGVKIISDNLYYQPIEVNGESENFKVIGKVHSFQRNLI